MADRRSPEHQKAVMDRRASSAARPIPSKKQARLTTRLAVRQDEIERGEEK